MPIEVLHWNPRRLPGPAFPGRRHLSRLVGRKVNNFGDLLGPRIVNEIVRAECLGPPVADRRLLAVGSILHLARTGDVVWGIGLNGKALASAYRFDALDVRAVRGPVTRDFLLARGVAVPEVYGDPGLLVGRLVPREVLRRNRPPRSVTVIPNLNDMGRREFASPMAVPPTAPIDEILGTIAASDLVVGSSLHAIIVAESFGIPARLVRSVAEPTLKYDDYYRGSGRVRYRAADTVDEAVRMGGETPPVWDSDALLAAFPRDLWSPPC